MSYTVLPSPTYEESFVDILRNWHFFSADESACEKFIDASHAAIDAIALLPNAYPSVGDEGHCYHFACKTVPFTLLYSIEGKTIILHDITYGRSLKASKWH